LGINSYSFSCILQYSFDYFLLGGPE